MRAYCASCEVIVVTITKLLSPSGSLSLTPRTVAI
jgi:hypothetical protein